MLVLIDRLGLELSLNNDNENNDINNDNDDEIDVIGIEEWVLLMWQEWGNNG